MDYGENMMSLKKNFNNYRNNFLTLYLTLLLLLIPYNYGIADNPDYEKILLNIQVSLDCERNTAIKVFYAINQFIEKIQYILSNIGSTDSNLIQNNSEYIDKIVKEYFESDKSTVQVYSQDNIKITTYNIKEYLHNIVNLKKKYNFTKFELIYDRNYIGMTSLKKINDSKYKISVYMTQLFSGYKDNATYNDEKKNIFSFILRITPNNTLNIRIDNTLVIGFRGGSIVGRIYDEITKDAIPDVGVYTNFKNIAPMLSTKDGWFIIDSPNPNTDIELQITFSAEGYVTKTIKTEKVPFGEYINFKIFLKPLHQVEIKKKLRN